METENNVAVEKQQAEEIIEPKQEEIVETQPKEESTEIVEDNKETSTPEVIDNAFKKFNTNEEFKKHNTGLAMATAVKIAKDMGVDTSTKFSNVDEVTTAMKTQFDEVSEQLKQMREVNENYFYDKVGIDKAKIKYVKADLAEQGIDLFNEEHKEKLEAYLKECPFIKETPFQDFARLPKQKQPKKYNFGTKIMQ